MLKSGFTSLALGTALGAAALATDITPVPVALAQTPAPSLHGPAFDAGLADRRAYEEWFASLTGDFKKGLEYWAGQRSLTKPGSCYLPDGSSAGEFTQGCLAGQQRLAGSDSRRKTEPDYRQGWNSYTPAATPPTTTEAPREAQSPSQGKSYSFADFSVPTVYPGPLRMPDFRGRDRDYATYRTRISEGIKAGPNFAGRYSLVQIGCGTGCRFVLLADVSTGKVYNFPLGGEEYLNLDLNYQLQSSMIIARWEGQKCFQEYFIWKGERFTSLGKSEVGESCT